MYSSLLFLIVQTVILWLLPQESLGKENPDKKIKFTYSADISNGLWYNGHVQVREKAFEGTYLRLKNDLGMHSWISIGGTASVNFYKKNIFEFTYSRHYFEGSQKLSNSTWFNGALYVTNSTADIHRTIYRDFEWIWKTRIFNTSQSDIFLRTSFHYERLQFHVDAQVDETSPLSETYEGFWRQQLPLPSLGIALDHEINQQWSLSAELFSSYLPTIKTWMQEGGHMYLAQSNADARLNISYHYKSLSILTGIWYKHYHIKEESREDENEFILNGIGNKFSVMLSF